MTTIFKTVRELIALLDAAQLYGISSRSGNVRCIFHADNTPSMKLYDDHFHCFGCGAHGDVTDFTAQIYGLEIMRSIYSMVCLRRIWSSDRTSGRYAEIV